MENNGRVGEVSGNQNNNGMKGFGNTEQLYQSNGMHTAEDMYEYAKKNKLGFNFVPFFQKKHFELIEKNLLENESVLVSFIGRHKFEEASNHPSTGHYIPSRNEGNITYWQCSGFFAYAITTEGRLMYAHWKPFKHDAMSIPLGNINNVNPNTNLFWGSVRIESFGDIFSVFWTKKVVSRITKAIQQGMSDNKDGKMDGITQSMARNSSNYREPQNNSDEKLNSLRRAKKAYDEGLITEENYKEIQNKLL